MRSWASAIATLWILACAVPASAQVQWGGCYVGAHVGDSFKTIDFSVTDSSQVSGSIFRTVRGDVGHALNFGGHFGLNRQLGRKIVVGGEVGLGTLDYHGEIQYALGNDAFAETDGGVTWTAMARVGYVLDHMMPYFAAGLVGSKNFAHLADTCNALPCGATLGEGSGTTSAIRYLYVFGAEFAAVHKLAGRGWSVRLEWIQVGKRPVLNTFNRTFTGPGVPSGQTFPVDVSTELPRGMIRVLVNIKLMK